MPVFVRLPAPLIVPANERLQLTVNLTDAAAAQGSAEYGLAMIGALVRMREPIPFDAPDAQPVGLIFVLLVPERATDLHLQILSELAQMFSDQAFREQLFAAATAADMHCLITEWRADA